MFSDSYPVNTITQKKEKTMSEGKSNSGLLAVIAVVLIAILGIAVYEMNDEPDTVGEAVEQAGEDIGNSIEDATN